MFINISKNLSFLFLAILMSIYVFNLKLNFFQIPLNFLMAIPGFLLFIFKYKLNIPNYIYKFFIYFSLLSFVFLISFLLNQKGDFYYFNEVVVYNLVFFFSCYFVKNCFCYFNFDYNLKNIIFVFSTIVSFQLLLSLLAFVNPFLFNMIFSIIDMNLSGDSLESFNQGRMVGVGAAFFASGIINSFLLILISFMLTYGKINKKENIYLLINFVLILIIGLLSSRTTIVGFLVSLIFLIFRKPTLSFYLIFPFFALFFILNNYLSESRLFELWQFGTNFITDFENSQANESTSVLTEMLKVIPNTYSTWIYGDSFFRNIYGGYYMSTDVGYLRVIFANGLLGLILYLCFVVYLINTSFDRNKLMVLSIVLLFFILMIKGFSNTFIMLLFLFFLIDKPRANEIKS